MHFSLEKYLSSLLLIFGLIPLVFCCCAIRILFTFWTLIYDIYCLYVLLFYKNTFYILDINTWHTLLHLPIRGPVISCPASVFWYTEVVYFDLVYSRFLSVFSFVFCASVVISKESLPSLTSSGFSTMCSFRGFRVYAWSSPSFSWGETGSVHLQVRYKNFRGWSRVGWKAEVMWWREIPWGQCGGNSSESSQCLLWHPQPRHGG